MCLPFPKDPILLQKTFPEKSHTRKKKQEVKNFSLFRKLKNLNFYKLNIGQITNVLFERTRSEGFITGFTSNYIRVEYPWQSKLVRTDKKSQINRHISNRKNEY